jgi:hypothetical protein
VPHVVVGHLERGGLVGVRVVPLRRQLGHLVVGELHREPREDALPPRRAACHGGDSAVCKRVGSVQNMGVVNVLTDLHYLDRHQ